MGPGEGFKQVAGEGVNVVKGGDVENLNYFIW